MARSMIKQKKFLHSFWEEVASTAVYVLNKCFKKKVEGESFKKCLVWHKTNSEPSQNFCSLCFTHVLDTKIRKLEDKSKTTILVGYHSTRAYRLYNPTKKVCINRDVVVNEVKWWVWTTHSNSLKINIVLILIKNVEEK